jgi:hypothetical protein
MTSRISYYALYRTADRKPPPGGLMIHELNLYRNRIVFWDHETRGWVLNTAVGVRMLWDDEDAEQTRKVSREEAEEIARSLGGTLPSEEELHRIVLESEAAKGLPPLAGE